MSEQSGCTEWEHSIEGFKPGGNIPKFGDIEPPIEPFDESRPPWPVSLRTSDVAGRPDIPIAEGLNNYILEKSVADFMTRNPITIREDKLAAEVLHVLKHHRIDDLVVVNADGAPLGLVDTQDLARFKLL